MPEDYWLNRNASASVRLTAQYDLWQRQIGWQLHPTIAEHINSATENVQVCDLACGNGIWVIDHCSQYPKAQFHGCDLSDAMFLHAHNWPENVKFRLLDARKPVPSELRHRFDVVHCRLILGAVLEDDPQDFLRTFADLLKPAGYLQWDEVRFNKLSVYPEMKAEAKLENFPVNLANRVRPKRVTYTWISQRKELLKDWGFENVAVLEGGPAKPELRRYWSDNEIGVLAEIASRLDGGGEEIQTLAEARSQGLDFYLEPEIVVSRKRAGGT